MAVWILVAANFTGANVSVLLNTSGAGTQTASFSAQTTFATGTSPIGIAVGDFNGDGRPDLAVTNFGAGTVSVLLNTTPQGATAPTFAAQQTFTVGANPVGIAVGDFNGDGRPDIAVANSGGGTVSVLLDTTALSATTPTFAAQTTFAVGTSPFGLAVGDFNGDGRADLVASNAGSSNVSVLLNTTTVGATTATFAAQQTFAVGTTPYTVAVGDFNSDGRIDIVAANASSANVSVLLNTTAVGATSASFATQTTFATGTTPKGVAVGDFDGDGKADIVVHNAGASTVSVLLNTTPVNAGTPTFAAQQTFTIGAGNDVSVPAVGDFNDDGRSDIAVGNFNDATISVLLNTTANFTITQPVLVGAFPGYGTQRYNSVTHVWTNLTPVAADILSAAPNGTLVAEFNGYGVHRYTPTTGWVQLLSVDAVAVVINPSGIIAASFPGYGVFTWRPTTGWTNITPVTASALAIDAYGDIAANFNGYGLQFYHPTTGWRSLGTPNASLVTVDAYGNVTADFMGYGIHQYRTTTGWTTITPVDATQLAEDALGDLVATFAGYGVHQYRVTTGWVQIDRVEGAKVAAAKLKVYSSYNGIGVQQYGYYTGWVRNPVTPDAPVIAVGDWAFDLQQPF
jgi:hypothetical protein